MKRLALFTIVAFSLLGTSSETQAGKLRDLLGPHRSHEGHYLLGGRRVRNDRWNLRAARVTPRTFATPAGKAISRTAAASM